jgi:hypothetical protein
MTTIALVLLVVEAIRSKSRNRGVLFGNKNQELTFAVTNEIVQGPLNIWSAILYRLGIR